jgi:hypothetical protein
MSTFAAARCSAARRVPRPHHHSDRFIHHVAARRRRRLDAPRPRATIDTCRGRPRRVARPSLLPESCSEERIVPREPLKISCRLETLSILAPDGQVDRELEPKIEDNDLRRLYKTMLASRRLDERCLQMQRQGRMGTYGPSKGQEAASLGAVYAMRKRGLARADLSRDRRAAVARLAHAHLDALLGRLRGRQRGPRGCQRPARSASRSPRRCSTAWASPGPASCAATAISA